MFDSGISYEGDLIDLGLAEEVLQRSGAWLNYGDLRLGQGRENAKTYLIENPDLRSEIQDKVLIAKGLLEAPDAEKTETSKDK